MGIFDWCCGPRRKDGEVSAPSAWISAATVGDLKSVRSGETKRGREAGTQKRATGRRATVTRPSSRPTAGYRLVLASVSGARQAQRQRPPFPNCAGQQWAAFLGYCHRQPRQPPCPGDRMTNPTDGLHVSGCARSVHGRDADRVCATPLLACELCMQHYSVTALRQFLLAQACVLMPWSCVTLAHVHTVAVNFHCAWFRYSSC